jgi:hypothetical protein
MQISATPLSGAFRPRLRLRLRGTGGSDEANSPLGHDAGAGDD